jgi:PhnB protein
MQTNPYLTFNGNCREAIETYAKILGGKIVAMITHKDVPEADCPAVWADRIMHARLIFDGNVLMASDTIPGQGEKMQGFSVALHAKSGEEAVRIFNGLAEGGTVRMPLQETFWAHKFGMLTDRFGTPWMLNYEKTMS